MTITTDELQDFERFAAEKLNGGVAQSLVELAREWEAERRDALQREREETSADIIPATSTSSPAT